MFLVVLVLNCVQAVYKINRKNPYILLMKVCIQMFAYMPILIFAGQTSSFVFH